MRRANQVRSTQAEELISWAHSFRRGCMTITRSQHLIPCTMVVVYYSSELYSLFQRVDGTLVETPVELVARVVDCVRVSLQLLLTGYS